ncbi:hypothetical protein ASG01_10395 [Chryseobacterium sp. Leaf180]|uniref:GAF domain-containing protein n=1 Tax=Chryseobacterium sp. Leaf180 TaxID=1736289 RepID=UPI0006FE4ACC|nr:GAF domain-containing protein [Chryseobacterium sp. Leaf180]KQR93569.1 hypothetical protein ASG01_10395 [Chryseobacterium sp. Leaf180]
MSQTQTLESPFQVFISFKKYLDVLEHIRYNDRQEYRASYAHSLIEQVKNFPELREGFQDLSLLTKHKDLIRLLLADLFPTGLTKNEIKAASMPLTNTTFNYSQRFQNILTEAGTDFNIQFRQINSDEFYIMSCCIILQIYFNLDFKITLPLYYDIPNSEGIIKHYKITINTDFSEIFPAEGTVLPDQQIIDMLIGNMDDVRLWKKHFPLKSWIFSGFSIISLVDCTSEVALSDLKSALIEIDVENLTPEKNFQEIFKSYFDIAELNFGLMLFDIKNKKLERLPIYANVFTNHLLDFWLNTFDENFRQRTFDNILYNPKPIVVPDVNLLDDEIKKLDSFKILKEKSINSFMVIPIVKDNQLLAVMEFTSPITNSLNGLKLKRLEFVTDMIIFSLNRFTFEKNNQIEAIIQREYTAIHDSVIWKFRNEAERYFNAYIAKKIYTLKEISFQNLTPLFGFSDIRASSEKRYLLMLEDLNHQIESLYAILSELSFTGTEKFVLALDVFENELNNDIKADTEQRFQQFLRENLHPFLQGQLETVSDESKKDLIQNYFRQVFSQNNLFYANRKNLDDSITLLNRKLADTLDYRQTEAQEIYPHYFERFKSDGVEHNLFIGQNIAPDFPYSSKILGELRFWQLETMCIMEQEVSIFRMKLPVLLDIASLIFVYNEKVDIRFRMDEKKFDVDGAYNSSYEIIKKRLEKAKIKNSEERITCPGKIVIVYFGMENQKEYLQYINTLQASEILKNDVEFLRVEDLQGISGLLALRVSLI